MFLKPKQVCIYCMNQKLVTIMVDPEEIVVVISLNLIKPNHIKTINWTEEVTREGINLHAYHIRKTQEMK